MCEEPTRYVVCGLGRRAWAAYLPWFAQGGGEGQLVGVVDMDTAQLDRFTQRWPKPIFTSTDLEEALDKVQPDRVILTTPDHAHAAQIIAALDVGVLVLTEKPMVVNLSQAIAVLDAAHRSAATLQVAHNMRFLNIHILLKRLLSEGVIGRVTQLSFSYHLEPGHGRSYFERWHRRTEWSGGLPVTKGSHHFDLFNWWLDDVPTEVFAWSARNHYFETLAGTEELPAHPPVPPDADISDTVNALIRYREGAMVQYSLSACSPWEGYELRMHGTKGHLTTSYTVSPALGRQLHGSYRVDVTPHLGTPRQYEVIREPGRHSGADRRMIDVALGNRRANDSDPERMATAHDGAYAVALGDAVSQSAARGVPISIPELAPVDQSFELI